MQQNPMKGLPINDIHAIINKAPNSTQRLSQIELAIEELETRKEILQTLQVFGVPDEYLNDESSNEIFSSARKSSEMLVNSGLEKKTALALASVEASMAIVERTGMTPESILDLVKEELPQMIRVLSKNTITLNDEILAGIQKRIIALMKETKSSTSFISALQTAISERASVVASLPGDRNVYVDESGVASLDNPKKEDN
jgi:hypothetical protein